MSGDGWEHRAKLAERKLAAIYHRALATEITAETADLRGFCMGIAAHESGALDPQWVVAETTPAAE